MLPSTSKERWASTSVDTRPGIILRISIPKLTNNLVIKSFFWSANVGVFDFAKFTASTIKDRYCEDSAAFRIKDGFVVASVGEYFLMASISPVSATTVVIPFN